VDAVVTFMPDRISEEDLRKFPRLKLIACALKGYDNFDITACTRRGITVTIVEDLLTIPSAELAIGLMIGLGRHLLQGDTTMRDGKFYGWRPRFYGLGLHGSTVGGSSRKGILRTLRRSKNHPTKINAPELDSGSFYGMTVNWGPAALC
jgi:phosphonate dehydrogenase